MKIMHTRIADHNIDIYTDSQRAWAFLSQYFFCFERREKDSGHLQIEIEMGYGVSFIDYSVETKGELDVITFKRADYKIEVDHGYKKAKIMAYDELALKHATMNLYSAFIVHHNWGILLHSSCAVDNEQAHIFTGHSGAGKSTAAELSQPRLLLSDEATIVKVQTGSVMIYNSPFRSELHAKEVEQPIPLASIQLLYQAPRNVRIQQRKSVALVELIDKVFYWSYRKEQVSQLMKLLKQVADEVPVYHLHFQKNNTFWELIS